MPDNPSERPKSFLPGLATQKVIPVVPRHPVRSWFTGNIAPDVAANGIAIPAAVHEAGHAIAVFELGFELHSVSIEGLGTSAGRTRFDRGEKFGKRGCEPTKHRGFSLWEAKVIVALAGYVANSIVTVIGDGTDVLSSAADFADAHRILLNVAGGVDWIRECQRLWLVTYKLMVDRVYEVAALARVLLTRPSLSGAEAYDVYLWARKARSSSEKSAILAAIPWTQLPINGQPGGLMHILQAAPFLCSQVVPPTKTPRRQGGDNPPKARNGERAKRRHRSPNEKKSSS